MAFVAAITKGAVDSVIKAEGIVFSSQTVISFQGEPSFDEATQRWNAYKAPSFSASITVGTEQDVSGAVKLARALEVGFLATSTRHGYGMTLNHLQGGLAIDLSHLDDIQVDGSTLTVGPGATTERVMDKVDKAGYEIPVGSHTTLSLVGVTIGAGVNRWSGIYGLVLDNLISARVVLHDGRLVEASESENPDLFWAIRGAGANFGIVVSATYKMPQAINHGEVFSVDVVLPIDQAKGLFDVLKSFSDNQPAELAIIFYVVWSDEMGQPIIVANWVWHGTEEEGWVVVAPLLALKTIAANARTLRWKDVIAGDAALRVENLSRVIYGVNLCQLDVATFESTVEKFVRFYRDFPVARGSAFVAEFFPNNAILQVADEATAYPWRDATANLMIQMSWVGSDSATEVAAKTLGEQLRQDHAKTGGYPGLSVYVNYAVGNESLEDVYGKHKLPRLLQLKGVWDPENVFKYHHPLLRE